VRFSAIVGPQGGCSGPGGDASPGTEYRAVSRAVGGETFSICRAEWAPVLEELGLRAAGLRREMVLSEVPVPGSLEVWVLDGDFRFDGYDQEVEGAQAACDGACFPYRYDPRRNAVVMDEYVPSPLAEVNLRYEVLGEFQPTEEQPTVPEGPSAPRDTSGSSADTGR